MGLKDLISDIRFSLHYDAEQLAKKNQEKYGDNVPDCCRMNRQSSAGQTQKKNG
jgi:hypothetical protein